MNAIKCPKCNYVNTNIDNELVEICGHAPVRCIQCGELYIVWHHVGQETTTIGHRIPLQLPPLNIGTCVLMITNLKHKFAGSSCEIVDKNHRRYRVRFNDGTLLWIPDHWVNTHREN